MEASQSQALDAPPTWKRTIVYHAEPDALDERTDQILSRLGYQMLLPETFDTLRSRHPELRAELLVIDEHRFESVLASLEPTGPFAGRPIVLLTGERGARRDDPRIVGAVKRPAGLHDLYRLMQQVFEDLPRSTPRVATHLRARCSAEGAEWDGRVLSISENGCLIRSPEPILLGHRVHLRLDLPRAGAVEVDAEATYQLLPDTGLVFSGLAADQREILGRFVADTILA